MPITPWTVSALLTGFAALTACASAGPDATAPPAQPAAATALPSPTPESDGVLIENVRDFLSSGVSRFVEPVDAEGDGRLARTCLEVLEGGPDGFEWSVETRDDGQTVVRIRHTASLISPETGTWLAIPASGVGTAPDSLNCNAVPNLAYERDLAKTR